MASGLFALPLSQQVFGLRLTYTVRVVALGGAILGVISGVLGCFAVLRQESLLGDALSHAALPGVAIAFLLVGRDLSWLLIGAGIASWLGLRMVAAILHSTRIKQDAALGIVLVSWFAAGIALLAYIQSIPDASQGGIGSLHLRPGSRHRRARCHLGQRRRAGGLAHGGAVLERVQARPPLTPNSPAPMASGPG